MKIDNLKALEKLIKLLRKSGVHTFKLDGMEFELGQLPSKDIPRTYAEDPMESIAVPEPNLLDPVAQAKAHAAKELQRVQDYIHNGDTLSEEEMMFYSAREQVGNETKQ